jgi:hypothetical protein
MANFNGLTFAVVPAVTGAGVLNTAGLPAGTVVAGILDPANGVHRIFNPQVVGLPVVPTDPYTKWLPTISAAGVTAATVNDQYWASTFQGSSATENATNNKFGQISIPLTPAAADTVNASSTLVNTKVSANALVITCTAGTF